MTRTKMAGMKTRVLILVAAMCLLLLVPGLLSYVSPADELPPPTLRHTAFLLIEGKNYSVADNDRDGSVDCLKPTGSRAIMSAGGYSAGEPSPGCRRGLGASPMPEDLRLVLSELLKKKSENDATYASAIDPDEDGRADCVLYTHNPEIVLFREEGAECPNEGLHTLGLKEQQIYSEILAMESTIRARIEHDRSGER